MMKVAILDLNEGQANQGMRCLRQILQAWKQQHGIDLLIEEFDVRRNNQIPDLSFDIYLSSGGPGSPLESQGLLWDNEYMNWIHTLVEWNKSESSNRKFVFFICHSFQLACRFFEVGLINKRKSTSFGVYPVHVTKEGQSDPVLIGLPDPFYVVDSRDYQVIQPDFEKLRNLGMEILCIEKYRPHIPYHQALMAIRFSPYMLGTQFHPEADAVGMSLHLQTEEKKKTVVENHGEAKWKSMVDQLNDPDKIMFTYAHVLPNFLSYAADQILQLA